MTRLAIINDVSEICRHDQKYKHICLCTEGIKHVHDQETLRYLLTHSVLNGYFMSSVEPCIIFCRDRGYMGSYNRLFIQANHITC